MCCARHELGICIAVRWGSGQKARTQQNECERMKHPPYDAQLREIASSYRRTLAEHEREGPSGSWRRRLTSQREELEEQYESLLTRWVPDEETRATWRAHLRGGAPPPPDEMPPPPLFRGRNDAGILLEIHESEDGQFDIVQDGGVVGRFPPTWEMAGHLIRDTDPALRYDGQDYEEIFGASGDALDALMTHVELPREPPWRWIRDLYRDGLVDEDFGLTDRGKRYVAKRRLARGW